jgi:hypothetical protein
MVILPNFFFVVAILEPQVNVIAAQMFIANFGFIVLEKNPQIFFQRHAVGKSGIQHFYLYDANFRLHTTGEL